MGEIVRFPEQVPPTNGPVTGELVDNDHGGLPDTSHAGSPGEVVERPAVEVVDVGPVLDAEFVEDAVPVDQPNERVPVGALVKRTERRPIIAPWLRSAEDTRAMVTWAAAHAHVGHTAAYHAVGTPMIWRS
jgi:hypothetical protein